MPLQALSPSCLSQVKRHIVWLTMAFACFPVVAAAPQDGDVFDNWTVRCEQNKDEGQQPQCFIFQNLILREGGQRVMHIAVGFLPERETPVALLTLPLGISLPPGGRIQVGAGEPVNFQIERCEPDGCRAGLILRDELFRRFRDSETADVTIFDGGRNPITVSVSLNGFAAGIDALRPQPAEAPPADPNAQAGQP
jgi:invasion protein IalB